MWWHSHSALKQRGSSLHSLFNVHSSSMCMLGRHSYCFAARAILQMISLRPFRESTDCSHNGQRLLDSEWNGTSNKGATVHIDSRRHGGEGIYEERGSGRGSAIGGRGIGIRSGRVEGRRESVDIVDESEHSKVIVYIDRIWRTEQEGDG
jgi:hypothetical protein